LLWSNLPRTHVGFKFLHGGALLTLESLIPVALLKISRAQRAFEFGTYTGATTRLLLENLHGTQNLVTTLDLPSLDGIEFEGGDLRLAAESLDGEREYRRSAKQKQVKQLLMDSMTFEVSGYEESFGLVFVDGNHKLEYLRCDSDNAFELVANDGCIAWHDYGNPEFPELTDFLNDLSSRHVLYHVEETMLCFYLPGRSLPESIGRKAKN